ncbi:MAG TPA: V-type ATPase 116kDa subunit family protein [Anaerolineaceae bacterium]|nr:V-type ATPase 116kDa subunit family protein [Anaerolineaceae bacterium]
MLQPESMIEVELVVPEKDIMAVTKKIGGMGVFQMTDGAQMTSGKESGAANAEAWQEKASGFAALERRIQTLLQTLGADEGQPPSDGVQDSADTIIDLEQTRQEVDRLEPEIRKASEQIASENKRIEQMEATQRQLEPVAGIEVDVSSLRNWRYTFSVLGTMPTANIERLETSLSRTPHILLPLRQDKQNAIVWLAGAQSNADVLGRAMRSAYINALAVPEGYQGTPSEIINTLQVSINEAQNNITGQRKTLAGLRGTLEKPLQELLWKVRASRLLVDAVVHSGKLRYTYFVVGWLPQVRFDRFKQTVKQASQETLIESFPINRSHPDPNVPVSLNNPRLLSPFENLVTTFGRPRYNEIDPTLVMAIMFPLLYGAMFGDAGQGLVLVLFGILLASRRIKKLSGAASLGELIIACGSSATIFGVLYGSFFGFENVIPALWMRPIENIMQILIIAIVGGVILLTIGFLLGLYNAYVARDWSRFFFDHYGLVGMALYYSLLGLAVKVFLGDKFPVPTSVFAVIAIISALGVALSEVFIHLLEGHRPLIEESMATYPIQIFFELFETVIGFLSNTLSYIRVGAFAVAHAGLSNAIFILAGLTGPVGGVGYWIVVFLGNVFIIGFEGFIVAIQTMRLSYYEFFTKFFTGGGKNYEPLKLYPSRQES